MTEPLQTPIRALALDVGDKRIGLAVSNETGTAALPLFTLHRTNLRADLKSIGRFIRQHKIEVLIVGNPLHADGSPSVQSSKVQTFAEALRDAHPQLEHHLLDERLTTKEAHALLDATGRRRFDRQTRLDRKDVIDQIAAVLILEAFLTGGRPHLLPDPETGPDLDPKPAEPPYNRDKHGRHQKST